MDQRHLATQTLLILLFAATLACAQSNNGKLLEQTPYKLPLGSDQAELNKTVPSADAGDPPLEKETVRRAPPPTEFEQPRTGEQVECFKLKYLSQGLQVVGYLVKPKLIQGNLPVIIYNRGGYRDVGHITLDILLEISRFAEAGFIVLASEYRGNAGGEGQDEYGGADVNDVLNLLPLIQSLPYADTKNLFLYGFARGGMMTYLALKQGLPVRAAAVLGAPTDLLADVLLQPEAKDRFYSELIPEYERRKDQLLKARSAYYWADKLKAPVLIQHGGADQEVPPVQALKLAERLQEWQKPYELVIYADDDHALTQNKALSQQRILTWFRRYLVKEKGNK